MSPATRRLLEEVHSAVRENPYLARRDLHFEHRAGRVTVRGTVESYYQKQLAQETLRRIDGVEEVDNRLSVCWPAEIPHGLAQSV